MPRRFDPGTLRRRCAKSRPAPGAAGGRAGLLRGKLAAVAALGIGAQRVRGRGRACADTSRPRRRARAMPRRPPRSPGRSRARTTARRRCRREMRAALARADEIEALADRLVDAAPRARPGLSPCGGCASWYWSTRRWCRRSRSRACRAGGGRVPHRIRRRELPARVGPRRAPDRHRRQPRRSSARRSRTGSRRSASTCSRNSAASSPTTSTSSPTSSCCASRTPAAIRAA